MPALIDRVLARSRKKTASPSWLSGSISYYKISRRSAGELVREAYGANARPPRPGFITHLPPTKFNGRDGYWMLSNNGYDYDLSFYYK